MPRLLNLVRTAAEWTASDLVGMAGQVGVVKDSGKYKVFDGVKKWSQLKYANTSPERKVSALGDSGAAKTVLDPDDGFALSTLKLTANCTLTFPPLEAGSEFDLVLLQDATGSRTVTWPAEVRWPGGTAPTLTTTANKRDHLKFVCADGTTWLGRALGQNYS